MKLILDRPDYLDAWVCAMTGGQGRDVGEAIGLEQNGKTTAAVLFDGYNGASLWMHLAIAPKTALPKGFINACFRYAFVQLACAVVMVSTSDSHAKAIRWAEWLGFTLRCAIPNGCADGSAMRIYALQRGDCRFIEDHP